MLLMNLNDGQFQCEIINYSESLSHVNQDNNNFNESLVSYEVTVAINTIDSKKSILDFKPFMFNNSISKLQILSDDAILYESQMFYQIDSISRTVNAYDISNEIFIISFRETSVDK